jgi:hypothetical protein
MNLVSTLIVAQATVGFHSLELVEASACLSSGNLSERMVIEDLSFESSS